MATTLQDIINAALLELNVLAEGDTANAGQSATGLLAANNLVNQWQAENLLTYTITRATATLTASQTSFSVGTAGNINIPRPVFIHKVAYVNTATSPNTELALPMLEQSEYEAIPQKSLTGTLPSSVYYNPTYPTGTLYPFPIPTSSTLLWAIYYLAAVAEFAAVTDSVGLPPGYRRMLIKNLALEMAPSFSRQPDSLLFSQAADAKAIVKRSNQRPQEMSFDAAILRPGTRAYNPWTDQ